MASPGVQQESPPAVSLVPYLLALFGRKLRVDVFGFCLCFSFYCCCSFAWARMCVVCACACECPHVCGGMCKHNETIAIFLMKVQALCRFWQFLSRHRFSPNNSWVLIGSPWSEASPVPDEGRRGFAYTITAWRTEQRGSWS